VRRTLLTVFKSGWEKALHLISCVNLSFWDSTVDVDAYPDHMAAQYLVGRHAFEDMCALVKTLPSDVHVWDLKRYVAAQESQTAGTVQFFLGDSFDYVDLALATTVDWLDARAYWCAYLAKHGALSRLFHRGLFDDSEHAALANAIQSLLVSAPMMLNKEGAVMHGVHWLSKQNVSMAWLGTLAVAEWAQTKRTGLLVVYLLSVLCAEGWTDASSQTVIFYKMLRVVQATHSHCDSLPDSKSVACLEPVHKWLEQVAFPSQRPEIAGFDWNEEKVDDLLVLLNARPLPKVTQIAVATPVPATPVPATPRSNVSVISQLWSKVRRAAPVAETRMERVERAPTERGSRLLLSYVRYLATMTLPYTKERLPRILGDLAEDASSLGRGIDGEARLRVAKKWLAWIDQECSRAVDK
jgi:hypothetical protein